MKRFLRRLTLVFPPVRRIRTQMHDNAAQIAALTRDLDNARKEAALRAAAVGESASHGKIESLQRLLDDRTRERDEARHRGDELFHRARLLERRCTALERDYFAAVDAQAALMRLAPGSREKLRQ